MKLYYKLIFTGRTLVAPFAGAWIEMMLMSNISDMIEVAPFAGAWIEIYLFKFDCAIDDYVAPFAGAWIEIYNRF